MKPRFKRQEKERGRASIGYISSLRPCNVLVDGETICELAHSGYSVLAHREEPDEWRVWVRRKHRLNVRLVVRFPGREEALPAAQAWVAEHIEKIYQLSQQPAETTQT